MGTVSLVSEKCAGSALNQTKAAHLVFEQVLRFCNRPDLSLYPPLFIHEGHLTLFSGPQWASLRNTQAQQGHESRTSHFDLVDFHDMSHV